MGENFCQGRYVVFGVKFARFNFAKHADSSHGSGGWSVCDVLLDLSGHEVSKLKYQPMDADMDIGSHPVI